VDDSRDSLTGKVVVITGAASGLGRALALDAAGRGALLALSDVDAVGLTGTADLAEDRTGLRPRTDRLDVRDRSGWREYAEALAASYGHVDVLVNNAGVALSGAFEELTDEQFDRVLDIDLHGVVNGTRALLPHLVASGDGHLVTISSVFGLVAVPGQSAYSAAKFAVRGFTEAVRQEMLLAGHPVKVTCVHPGGVRTAIARNAEVGGAVDGARLADFFDQHLARTTSEQAARVILDGMLAGRPRVLVGRDAKLLDAVARLLPAGYQRLAVRSMRRLRSRLEAPTVTGVGGRL
jgi:NAD(P)-dependent dehydrogenase (short-subunit alcohol dehydrogenase family)